VIELQKVGLTLLPIQRDVGGHLPASQVRNEGGPKVWRHHARLPVAESIMRRRTPRCSTSRAISSAMWSALSQPGGTAEAVVAWPRQVNFNQRRRDRAHTSWTKCSRQWKPYIERWISSDSSPEGENCNPNRVLPIPDCRPTSVVVYADQNLHHHGIPTSAMPKQAFRAPTRLPAGQHVDSQRIHGELPSRY